MYVLLCCSCKEGEKISQCKQFTSVCKFHYAGLYAIQKKIKIWMHSHTDNIHNSYQTPDTSSIHFNTHYLHLLYGMWCTCAAEVTDLIWPPEAIRLYTQYDELLCLQAQRFASCHCWAYTDHNVEHDLCHPYGMVTVLFKSLFLIWRNCIYLPVTLCYCQPHGKLPDKPSNKRNIPVRQTAPIHAKQRNSILVSVSFFTPMTTTAKCGCIIHN